MKVNEYADFFIGGVSGIVSRTLTAPLELHKLHKQNSFMPNANVLQTYRTEGLYGLWKGNLVNSIRIFPQMSITYYVYNQSKIHIWSPNIDTDKSKSNTSSSVHMLSGATGGVVSTIIIYPLETIRSRISLQIHKSHYEGILDSFRKISARDLYRGLSVSICGFVPFNALSFTFYHYYKEKFANTTHKKYERIVPLLAGGISGISAITITYPTDLIRKRMQLQNYDKHVPKYKTSIDCIKKIYKYEGGIKGVYCGLFASYIKLFPALAIQFYTMETLKSYTHT